MSITQKSIESLAKLIEAINEDSAQGLLTREDWDTALDKVFVSPGTTVFKAGDRVRLTGSGWWDGLKGEVVTVHHIDETGAAIFYLDEFKYGSYVISGHDYSATLVEKAQED